MLSMSMMLLSVWSVLQTGTFQFEHALFHVSSHRMFSLYFSHYHFPRAFTLYKYKYHKNAQPFHCKYVLCIHLLILEVYVCIYISPLFSTHTRTHTHTVYSSIQLILFTNAHGQEQGVGLPASMRSKYFFSPAPHSLASNT